jgi:methionyl-tRNA formyltransferase
VNALRLAFAGTPEFAACALRRLLAEGWPVALVLTQPDRPAGRGMKLQPSAVKAVALEHGLALAQPRSLRLDGKYPDDAAAAKAALQAAGIDLMVVAAYGLILPAWTLALPPRGCLNIHGSLLPRWRGAAPIQRAIEAGDRETGVTIMQMDQGLDTGAMLLTQALPITDQDTSATLHDKLAALGAELIVGALRNAEAGRLQPTPQPVEGVTYAAKIDKAEAAIDWRADAALLARRVRAFDPFPGAHFTLEGETIKVWRARPEPSRPRDTAPGQVLAADPQAGLQVACGEGALNILEVQRPGGRRAPVQALLQSRGGLAGRRLD